MSPDARSPRKANERLRGVVAAAQLTSHSLAALVEVDPKSVDRWISEGRIPQRRTRALVAEVLGHEETFLWPELQDRNGHSVELVQMWPSRDAVPAEVWDRISRSKKRLDTLTVAGGFMIEVYRLLDTVRRISVAGGQVRICVGDPDSAIVLQRGLDEGLPSLPGRARAALEYWGAVVGLSGVEIRTHSTPLYVSIFRSDRTLLVNTHTHGLPAMSNPLMHFEYVPGQPYVPYYDAAFERVWESATPFTGF